MDEFLKDIVDCFNSKAPVHADTPEEVLEKLDKAFKAGDAEEPLRFRD